MSSSSALRLQIETALAKRIPSALTPSPRIVRPVSPAGICPIDNLLGGGLPLGAITEIIGSESSGCTSFSLSFIAQITKAEKVCAWIDVSDTLRPESATAIGVELKRLLWVRCGVQAATKMDERPQSAFAIPDKYQSPSQSVEDLVSRVPSLNQKELTLLARIGALNKLDGIGHRRDALWQVERRAN